jgi:hypothetical protein
MGCLKFNCPEWSPDLLSLETNGWTGQLHHHAFQRTVDHDPCAPVYVSEYPPQVIPSDHHADDDVLQVIQRTVVESCQDLFSNI